MPGGKISEIYGEIRIQITKMQQDLALAQKKLDNFQKQISPIFGQLAKTVAITGAAITAVMTKSVLDTVRHSEETLKLAKALGMTTDEVQELAYAAKQADTNIEAFQKGTTQLLMQMSRARDGSEEAAKSFKRLGISYKNQDGTLRSTKDVLMDIADKMKSGKLSADQLAIATDLFGARTAKELIPMLMKGSDWFKKMTEEAHKFGIILSEEDVKAAEEFGDKIDFLKEVINGLKRSLAIGLLPALNQIIDLFKKSGEQGEGLRDSLEDVGKFVGSLAIDVMIAVNRMREAMTDFGAHITNLMWAFTTTMTKIPGLGGKFEELNRSMRFLHEGFVEQGKDLQKNEDMYIKMKKDLGEVKTAIEDIQPKIPLIPYVDLAEVEKAHKKLIDEVKNWEFPPIIIEAKPEGAIWPEDVFIQVDEEFVKTNEDLEKIQETAMKTAESIGELFGTAIRSGGDWLVMLKKIIGQQIRYNVLSKMGWQGQFFSGLMQVFGFQEGGFIPKQMPIINVAAINENPRRPEVAIDMSGRGITAIPLDQIGKFVEVKNYVNVAGADVFIRSLVGAKKDAFDELAIPISEALTRRDNR